MDQSTERPPVKICLRADCTDHADDASWLHPTPQPRPAYPAGDRLKVAS